MELADRGASSGSLRGDLQGEGNQQEPRCTPLGARSSGEPGPSLSLRGKGGRGCPSPEEESPAVGEAHRSRGLPGEGAVGEIPHLHSSPLHFLLVLPTRGPTDSKRQRTHRCSHKSFSPRAWSSWRQRKGGLERANGACPTARQVEGAGAEGRPRSAESLGQPDRRHLAGRMQSDRSYNWRQARARAERAAYTLTGSLDLML